MKTTLCMSIDHLPTHMSASDSKQADATLRFLCISLVFFRIELWRVFMCWCESASTVHRNGRRRFWENVLDYFSLQHKDFGLIEASVMKTQAHKTEIRFLCILPGFAVVTKQHCEDSESHNIVLKHWNQTCLWFETAKQPRSWVSWFLGLQKCSILLSSLFCAKSIKSCNYVFLLLLEKVCLPPLVSSIETHTFPCGVWNWVFSSLDHKTKISN